MGSELISNAEHRYQAATPRASAITLVRDHVNTRSLDSDIFNDIIIGRRTR